MQMYQLAFVYSIQCLLKLFHLKSRSSHVSCTIYGTHSVLEDFDFRIFQKKSNFIKGSVISWGNNLTNFPCEITSSSPTSSQSQIHQIWPPHQYWTQQELLQSRNTKSVTYNLNCDSCISPCNWARMSKGASGSKGSLPPVTCRKW